MPIFTSERRPRPPFRQPTFILRAACGLAMLLGAHARSSALSKPAVVSCKAANPQDSSVEQCQSWCKADQEHTQHCRVRHENTATCMPCPYSSMLLMRQFCKCKSCSTCGGTVSWPPKPPPNPSPSSPPPFCGSTADGDSPFAMCEPWCISEFALEHCPHCKCRGCRFCGPSHPPRPSPPPPPPWPPPPPRPPPPPKRPPPSPGYVAYEIPPDDGLAAVLNVSAAGGLTGVVKVIAPLRRRQAVSPAGSLGLVGIAAVVLAGAAFVVRRRSSEDVRRPTTHQHMVGDAEDDDTTDHF